MDANVQQILDTITTIGTSVTGIAGDIQSLKDQLASGAQVTQADLDNIRTKLQNLATQAADIDAQTP